jgi:hypothetical protein
MEGDKQLEKLFGKNQNREIKKREPVDYTADQIERFRKSNERYHIIMDSSMTYEEACKILDWNA